MTDFYERGLGLGTAYLDGKKEQDAAALRALNIRAKTGEVGDVEYARQRSRGMDAERDATAATSGNVGIPVPAAAGSVAPDAAAGVAPPPPAPPSHADRLRVMARQSYRAGSPDFVKYEHAARDADFTDAYANGVKNTNIEQAMAQANLQNDRLTVHKLEGKAGYELLVVRPDGTTHKINASEAQARQLAGLRNAMHVDPERALQGIAKIDADLATLFSVQLKEQTAVTTANNTARHQQGTDEYHGRMADAAMARASHERASNVRAEEQARRDKAGEAVAGEAAGLRQGYETARRAGPAGKAAADIYATEHNNAATRGAGLGVKVPKIDERPPVDPVKYADTITKLTASGLYTDAKGRPDPAKVRMEADRLWGVDSGADDARVLDALATAKAAKNKVKTPAPGRTASGVVTSN